LDYGFSSLPENHRSVRVAEKIGMQVGALEIFHDIPVIAFFKEAKWPRRT
jgi:RimJ/RimL family protein N-acetyltransferase